MPPWLVAEGPAAYYCWGMQRMQATTAARALTFLAALAALSSLCLVSATAWADPAGIIKTLSGPMSVVRGGATMPATVGMALEAKDVVRTGAAAAVGITLADDSGLSAGPETELVLEEFAFDSTTHDGTAITRLRRGTLSVASGKLAKRSPEAMKVRTPQSVLGVRGTLFAVKVVE